MRNETVFIGGSRLFGSALRGEVGEKLEALITEGRKVIVGDANGIDKAVQIYLASLNWPHVAVYYSGDEPRNNFGDGDWELRRVEPPRGARGFQIHAAKDAEMAREADWGFMLWDGESAGTIHNALRLVMAEKLVELCKREKKGGISLMKFNARGDWEKFWEAEGEAEWKDNLLKRLDPHEEGFCGRKQFDLAV